MTASDTAARAVDVSTTDDELIVHLVDGRTIIVPLAWYPRLSHAAQNNDAISASSKTASTSTGRKSTKT